MNLICLLAAAAPFISQIPQEILDRLTATNETSGVFTQTKRFPDGPSFVSSGDWRIRPGKDFTWRIREPFEAVFSADKTKYTYSNEDERVTRPLADLKDFPGLDALESGDFSIFFKAFDALYKKEPDGTFHILAKPKEPRIAKVLSRVEADGTLADWTLRATFADRSSFEIRIQDAKTPPAP